MRLLYLCLLSFVFIATSALALSRESINYQVSSIKESKTFTLLPVLSQDASFPIVSAQAALAVDLTSGVTLYEREPDKYLLPASTTKIVTALVAMEHYLPEQVLEVPNLDVEGQDMELVAGEKIRVEDLLSGLLMFSANDAAEALAQNFPGGPASPSQGGRDAFILAMNSKARELHLENSNFVNPTGLDGDGQVTTARDLIRAASVAMQNPQFAEIVGTKEKVVKSTDGVISHRLTNINELIGSVDGVLGVKTGWTETARENLVTYMERDNRRIMIALLASQDRFGETKELIEWIFDNYEWQSVTLP